MKAAILILALFFSSISIYSQDAKNEAETVKTKMDVFSSKTGIITKFSDTNLTGIKATYGVRATTRIRKINSGNIEGYFYQIEKTGKYSNSTASIEYTDLLELIKAMETLKLEEVDDVVKNPDYLENKFITEDGFQVGYYVSKGKSAWYLKLEKYGSDSTLFVKDGETIINAFNEAKGMIDNLKN